MAQQWGSAGTWTPVSSGHRLKPSGTQGGGVLSPRPSWCQAVPCLLLATMTVDEARSQALVRSVGKAAGHLVWCDVILHGKVVTPVCPLSELPGCP